MLTILLVDDDPFQASVRKSMLEKRFSDVLRVAGAADALCLVEQPQFADSLGLVISGHRLAGIGGPAFVAELHTRIPTLPVLVLGDSSEERSEYPGQNVSFLTRPILADQLLALASKLLAENERKTA
jgi:DNA-binding NtrC family response regulator